MEYLEQISKQGLGYLLFAASLFVIFFLYKENQKLNNEKVDLANKRVEDLQEARDAYTLLSNAASKTAENTLTIVQNIQQLLTNWRKT